MNGKPVIQYAGIKVPNDTTLLRCIVRLEQILSDKIIDCQKKKKNMVGVLLAVSQ